MIKAVIFDMDGTMFDTETISVRAMQQVAKKYGVFIGYEDALQFLGLPTEVIRQRFLEKFGNDFDYYAFRKDKISLQNAVISEKGVPIKAGLPEVLDYLKEKGVLTAVATSTSRERASDLLLRANVVDYFDTIVCGDEVECGKPNPDIFWHTAEKMGVRPEDCIVIEDSRNGIFAASRSGSFAILVPDLIPVDEEMRSASDLICDDLYGVLEYIKSIVD